MSCLLACASWHGVAAAQSARLELDWQAPEGCPERDGVLEETARILRGSTVTAEVRARAIVRRDADGSWRVTLETESDSGRGRRELRGESCQAVAGATALILALAVDPEAALVAPEPPAAPEPAAALEQPPVPKATAAPAPPARPAPLAPRLEEPRAVRLVLGVGPTSTLGVLPQAAIGGRLSVGAEWLGRWLVLGDATLLAGADASMTPDQGGSFHAEGGRLRAGWYALSSGTGALAVLGGTELWHLHGTGYGVSAPRSAETWWLAALLGARAELRASARFRLALEAEMAAPFSRPEFALEGIGSVHRVSSVLGSATLAAVLVF